jgi:sodium/bile acid cotransporter 7
MNQQVWSSVAVWRIAVVVGVCVVLLAVVLTITWYAGKLFGFPLEDRLVLLFCGSKKSMATGIPMAGILFAGHAVPLIVLPIMLFHQIQLFACTIIAQRYARENAARALSPVLP